MTPQILIGLSSVVAVFLLPAAGYLFGRARQGDDSSSVLDGVAKPAPSGLPDGKQVQEIANLRKQLQAAQEQSTKLGSELTSLKQHQGQAAGDGAKAKQELAELKQRMAALVTERDQALQRAQALHATIAADDDMQAEEPTLVQSADSTMEVLEQRLAGALENQEQTNLEKGALESQVRKLSDVMSKLSSENASLNAKVAPVGDQPAQDRASMELRALQQRLDVQGKELEDKIRDLQAANKTQTDIKKKLDEAQQAIATFKARELGMSKQLAGGSDSNKIIEDQKARLAAAEAKVAQVDKLEEERFVLKSQQKELKAEIDRLKELEKVADEKYDLAIKVESLQQKEKETETLREDKAQLTQKLNQAEHEAKHLAERLKEMEGIESDRKDLAIKMELLEKQVKDSEVLREDNATLKATVEGMDNMANQIKSLEQENTNLRSLATVSSQAKPKVVAVSAEGLAGSLQQVLEQLGKEQGSRGAVVADEQGLVVAGIGEHAEALAAAAAVFEEVGRRVQAMLPISNAQQNLRRRCEFAYGMRAAV